MSVATGTDPPRHYGLACIGYWTEYVALAGPELLDVLEGSPLHRLSELPPETLERGPGEVDQGISVDFEQKEVWLWSLNRFASPAWIDLIEQSWEGWQIRQHVEGLPKHAVVVGVSPASVRLPWGEFLDWFEWRATTYAEGISHHDKVTPEQVAALYRDARDELPSKPDVSSRDSDWSRVLDTWRRRRIASVMAKVRREGLPSYPDSPYRSRETGE